MGKRLHLAIFMVLLVALDFLGCSKTSEEKLPKAPISVGPVKLNSHPASLEGKTVILRWNGKYNGDRFLSRVAELLNKQVKSLKVIKMWEVDSSTASISNSLKESEKTTAKIAEQKPDIVIASQAD